MILCLGQRSTCSLFCAIGIQGRQCLMQCLPLLGVVFYSHEPAPCNHIMRIIGGPGTCRTAAFATQITVLHRGRLLLRYMPHTLDTWHCRLLGQYNKQQTRCINFR